MIGVRRDSTGILASLRCDACNTQSVAFGIGRLSLCCQQGVDTIRAYIRSACEGSGWAQLPTVEQGQTIVADLCPRCASKVEAVLHPKR